jgi:hypothetical protein
MDLRVLGLSRAYALVCTSREFMERLYLASSVESIQARQLATHPRYPRISAGSTTASQSKSLHESVSARWSQGGMSDGMRYVDIPITDVLDLIDYLTTTITDTEEKPSPVLP